MRTPLLCLLTALALAACDPNADSRVGNQERFKKPPTVNNPGSGGGSGFSNNSGAGSTTDAPLDGGLSLLLLAGSAYGVRRFAGKKQKAAR